MIFFNTGLSFKKYLFFVKRYGAEGAGSRGREFQYTRI